MDILKQQHFDICFLQETNAKLRNSIPDNYHLVTHPNSESIILLKKETFPIVDVDRMKNMNESLKKELNWNGDSAFCFVKNMIIVSGHLSSKQDRNAEQVVGMMKCLHKLKQ